MEYFDGNLVEINQPMQINQESTHQSYEKLHGIVLYTKIYICNMVKFTNQNLGDSVIAICCNILTQ